MQNQPNPGGAPRSTPARQSKNAYTYALQSLLAGAASLVITLITTFVFQKVFIYVALLGVYGVYAGIRGIITGMRMKGQGMILSVIGLIISIVAIVVTALLLIP